MANGEARIARLIAALPLLLPVPGCFDSLKAPRCDELSDCPPGGGYTSCEDGMCFKSGKCDDAKPVPGDACCARTEGDRTEDTDCLVFDIDLFAKQIATPAADAGGNLFVAGTVPARDGTFQVRLWRIAASGTVSAPRIVGQSDRALPPVLSREASVYVAYQGGVMRYTATDLKEQANIPSGPPVGALVSTGGAPRALVGWVTADGQVVLHDEDKGQGWAYPLDPQHWKPGDCMAPVVFSTGKKMAVVDLDGHVVLVSMDSTPLGPVAVGEVGAAPAGPPVESGGSVFVATVKGELVALHAEGAAVKTRWTVDLQNEPTGRLLVDSQGSLWIPMKSGLVVVLRDADTTGLVTGAWNFGKPLQAGPSPLLTAKPRVVAFAQAASGARVVSLIRTGEASAPEWSPGLSFDVPIGPSGSPTLVGRHIVFGTASGHLVSWVFPDDLATTGWAKEGGNAANSGRVGTKQ